MQLLFGALLCAQAALGAGVATVRGGDHSVAQVVETLQRVRRSLEGASKEAESLGSASAGRCAAIAHRLDAASPVHLRADLESQEAQEEEMEGTIAQVEADVDRAKKSLLPSDATHKPSAAMEDNRRKLVMSLEGELAILMPALAQVKAAAAESRRQLADSDRSAASLGQFGETFRAACVSSANRTLMQRAAANEELSGISTALEVLQKLAPEPRTSFLQLARHAKKAQREPNLVVDEATEQDLMSMFEASPVSGAAATPASLEAAISDQSAKQETHATEALAKPDAEQGPKIQTFLNRLQDATRNGTNLTHWCEQERVQARLALRLAQASAVASAADVGGHAEAQSKLEDDLYRIRNTSLDIGTMAKQLSDSVVKERAHLQSRSRDQALAGKILTQAMAILSDLKSSGVLARDASGAASASDAAIEALKTAQVQFFVQAQATAGMLDELDTSSRMVVKSAQQCVKDLTHERVQIEAALASHAAGQARSLENQRINQQAVLQALQYAKDLKRSCDVPVSAPDSEAQVEIQALHHAQDLLSGKTLEADDVATNGLRGSPAPLASSTGRSLSPLERAAVEMGVSLDAS